MATACLTNRATLTTTLASVRETGTEGIGWVNTVAISNDARYVAYSASTADAGNIWIGFRVFLHDRLLGTTLRVDTPLPSSGDVFAYSREPDFERRRRACLHE